METYFCFCFLRNWVFLDPGLCLSLRYFWNQKASVSESFSPVPGTPWPVQKVLILLSSVSNPSEGRRQGYKGKEEGRLDWLERELGPPDKPLPRVELYPGIPGFVVFNVLEALPVLWATAASLHPKLSQQREHRHSWGRGGCFSAKSTCWSSVPPLGLVCNCGCQPVLGFSRWKSD